MLSCTEDRIRRVLELFLVILFPEVHGHRQKYTQCMLDRRKICNNHQVHSYDVINICIIVKENNCCLELLLTKSMGGEFVATSVEMAPR